MTNKQRLAVIYGGNSPEHDVSIITAVQAMSAAKKDFEVIPLYVTKTGKVLTGEYLKSIKSYSNQKNLLREVNQIDLPSSSAISIKNNSIFTKTVSRPFDFLFPCFHGGVGEGGWIQGLAEYYQIPLIGTGLTGAAIGMDKVAMKAAFAGSGIQQAPYLWFYNQEWQTNQTQILKKITSSLTYPLFVKPSRGGSSIGTTCAHNQKELIYSIDLACALDTRIVVEEGIMDTLEINVSTMGNPGHPLESSVCEQVFHKNADFLDFEDKYISGNKSKGMASAIRTIPAQISSTLSNKIQSIAKDVFRLLDCSGLVRTDFLVKNNQVYCVEVNTIPGCLSFFIWEKSGYTYPELIKKLVELAQINHKQKLTLNTSYHSSILEDINSSTSSKLSSKLG